MTHRNTLALMSCLTIAGCVVSTLGAVAQNAPFTIRRPPDGSVVREKVRIEIPLSSIKMGAFVAIYLDEEFQGALIPDEKAEKAKKFTYTWDTKLGKVPDGPHTVRAVLYEPAKDAADSVTSQQKAEFRQNHRGEQDQGRADITSTPLQVYRW